MSDDKVGVKERLIEVLVYFLFFAFMAAMGLWIVTAQEHADELGGRSKFQKGRAKNSVAAVVSGLVAHQVYGNSRIEMTVEKTLWPDARVTGHTSLDSLESEVGLAVAVARFTAKKNSMGWIEGEMKKSGFDWKVTQIESDKYEIDIPGPKFNASLELRAQGGNISGMFYRPGFQYEWIIDGTYDQEGNVDIEIDGRLTLGIKLTGLITPK